MKYLVVVCWLISGASLAQEKPKRPSWSQGLPERTQTPDINTSIKPGFSSTKPVFEKPEPELRGHSEDSKMAVEFVPEPLLLNSNVEIIVDTYSTPAQERNAVLSGSPEAETTAAAPVNPLVADYSWQVLKTEPIALSHSGNDQESLQLNIQIDPQGRVTRVTKADPEISGDVMKQAERSILKWRFEPPEELGIKENISKVFTIDIEVSS